MRKLRIFGDSHVHILENGWKQRFVRRPGRPDPSFEIEFYGRHGANWFEFETQETPTGLRFLADRFRDYPKYPFPPVDYFADDLDAVYVFSSPLHTSTIYRDATWRKFCPWECLVPNPDLQAVSTAAMEGWSESQVALRLTMLRKMKECGFNVAVVEPPKLACRTPNQFGFRADVLVKIDQIYRGYVSRRLAAIGVPVITVPENSQSGGLTVESYSLAFDPHHGNGLFGIEMMDKIFSYASVPNT